MMNKNKYLLVDTSIVPEVFNKVIEVKNILAKNSDYTVNDAVKIAGISRSAFYKYKDYIFPISEFSVGRVLTLFFVVEDYSGLLSNIIKEIAGSNANILTINQNIPVNGVADVTISVDTQSMTTDIEELMKRIGEIEGVRRQEIIARE
jgi:ACT domain-containing protein